MDIRVPQLAEGVESGTVVSILVKAGDKVKKNQNVVELETNKAVAGISSTIDGVVVKVLVSEGAQVAIGQVLVSISESGAAVGASSDQPSSASKSSAGQAPVQARPAANLVSSGPVSGGYQYHSVSGAPPPASPSVRQMARDLGIDLNRVQGTELGGRITMADVRNYITYLQQSAFSGAAPASIASSAPAEKKTAPSIDFSKWGPVTKKPMTQLRKTISDAMVNSWTTIPHVTQFDDVDISAVMKLRKTYAADYEKKGAHLTLTPFIVKAVVVGLKKYPAFNASMDENTKEIIFKEYYHIGIAVDTEHGLMVPVIHDADKKSLLEISLELEKLADKTRARKLGVEDMQGGTFTISNQGGIGGRHFTPIINKPEVAILGVGRGGTVPIAAKTGIQTAVMMPVGFSYDHRVVDGGSAARFIVAFGDAMNSFTNKDVALQTVSKKREPQLAGKKGKK